MNTTVRFTAHARARVENRISLTDEEIADILESDACAVVGKGQGKNRVLILFWSKPDEEFFVAVKSEDDNTIITIILLAWMKIRVDKDIMTRLIYLNSPRVLGKKSEGLPKEDMRPQAYSVSIFLRRRISEPSRTLEFRLPLAEHPECAENPQDLEKIPEAMAKIREFVQSEIKEDEYVSYACVSIGKKGEKYSLKID